MFDTEINHTKSAQSEHVGVEKFIPPSSPSSKGSDDSFNLDDFVTFSGWFSVASDSTAR